VGRRATPGLDAGLIEDTASQLAAARRLARACAPPSLGTGLTEAGAYLIQAGLVAAEIAAGERVVGFKVGATSRRVQELLGCREPFFGRLFGGGRLPVERVEGESDPVFQATLDLRGYLHPRLECEVAFFLGDGLKTASVRDAVGARDAASSADAEDVLAATEWVAASFEIIDSRVDIAALGLSKTAAPQVIADNGGYAAHVPSGLYLLPREVEWSALRVALHHNGGLVAEGGAEEVMGHPARSLAWLAGALAHKTSAKGPASQLEAGWLVLSGTMTPPQALSSGDVWTADFGPLGILELRCVD